MTFPLRIFATLALGALGAIAAAGVYAEIHRVPDQS
jgi:multisubunit Na+/H+ antiporter MnhB subunit